MEKTSGEASLMSLCRESLHIMRMALGRGEGGVLARGAGGSVLLAVSGKLLALVTSVVLARALAPAGYGTFAFVMSLAGVLGILAGFGVLPLLTREVAMLTARGDSGALRELVRGSIRLVLFWTSVVVGGVAVVVWLTPAGGSPSKRLAVTIGLGILAINALGGVPRGVLMGMRKVILGQLPAGIVQPLLFLLLLGAVSVVGGGHVVPQQALLFQFVTALIALVITSVWARRALPRVAVFAGTSFSPARLIGRAAPFVLLAGLFIVNAQTDIVMLGLLSSSETVGVYRVAVAGAGLVPFVLGAVNEAVGPAIARTYGGGDSRRLGLLVRLTTLVGVAGAVPIVGAFVFAGKHIVGAVFGGAYLAAISPLLVLCAGQAMNAVAGPVALLLNMTGFEKDTAMGVAVAATLNVALNASLIPTWGALGAAVATATSTAVWNALLVWRVWRRIGIVTFAPVGTARIAAGG